MSAGDHVVGAFRKNRPVDENWLLEYFTAGGASYDDLLALAYLEQRHPGGDDVRAMRSIRIPPLAVTRGVSTVQSDAPRMAWGPLGGPRGGGDR